MTTIPESEVMQLHAEVCAALSEPKRIMIIYELAAGPRHVTDLAAALHSPQPVISRHLKVLRERGVVAAERQGSMVVYSLADGRVVQALDLLRAFMASTLTDRARVASVPRAPGGEAPYPRSEA
jgi:DNA-binding transcriptional ArsR family regulator